MAIVDLYSKRRKRERGEVPDVYQYDVVPYELRVQVVHVWTAAIGELHHREDSVWMLFSAMENILCREYGTFGLTSKGETPPQRLANFMLQTDETDRVLDVIELVYRCIDRMVRDARDSYPNSSQEPDDAIAELNARFREHGVGFQYESGKIIRVDSQIIHTEVVKPALKLLSEKGFEGANEEFLSAHEHYRNRKYKECLTDCLKSFESTMKSICTKRKWTFQPGDTAKALLDVLFQKALIPVYMQSHFTGLRATLEAGVPTIRNKLGGHGQGTSPVSVPDSIAAYALHLTATNIVFLVQAEKELP